MLEYLANTSALCCSPVCGWYENYSGFPIPDVDNLCLLCIGFYVWDAVSIFNHLPRMFLSTYFAFRITDWTCCHGPHLHAILRLISRGVSCLATDSPCGVWGRGWTNCLLHDSPLFGSHFKMRVGMQIWSDISYIYFFLPRFTVSCMKLVIFLLYNNLFIYQVLCTLIYRRRSLYSFLLIKKLYSSKFFTNLKCILTILDLRKMFFIIK